MRPLSLNDCRSLSSTLETIYRIPSLTAFPTGVLSAVRNLFRSNTICFNEVVPPKSMATWVTDPINALPSPALQAAFVRNLPEHPVIGYYARTGDSASYRISDFLSRQQFHRLSLYSEYYKPLGVEYQLITAISNAPHQIGLAFDRDIIGFSDGECLVLDLIRPHLLQAYRNVQKMDILKQAIEAKGKLLLIVNRSGEMSSIPDEIWQVMDRYFTVPRLHNSLPDILKCWVVKEVSRFGEDGDAISPSIPLVIIRGNKKLTVHFFWGGKVADSDMVLLEEEFVPAMTLNKKPNLTAREAEILTHLTEGRTNGEIAAILSISPLTVKKHLEHIYDKLEVHGRGAAVALSHHQ